MSADRGSRLHPDGRTLRAASGGDRARLGEIARPRDALCRIAPASRGSESRSPPTPLRVLGDWRRRWVVAVAALGLEAEASIEGAETALEVWDKAFNDGENHRNRMRRVAGIQRNMNDFETEARALIQRCAPTAADLPAEAAARLLNERLVAARTAQTKRQRGGRAEGDGAASARGGGGSPGKGRGDNGDARGRLPPGSDVVALLAARAERSRLAEALGRQRHPSRRSRRWRRRSAADRGDECVRSGRGHSKAEGTGAPGRRTRAAGKGPLRGTRPAPTEAGGIRKRHRRRGGGAAAPQRGGRTRGRRPALGGLEGGFGAARRRARRTIAPRGATR